jgi:hypothetical protein
MKIGALTIPEGSLPDRLPSTDPAQIGASFQTATAASVKTGTAGRSLTPGFPLAAGMSGMGLPRPRNREAAAGRTDQSRRISFTIPPGTFFTLLI